MIDTMEALAAPIQIVYTTTTGNSQTLAEEAAEKLEEAGLPAVVCDMENFSGDTFYEIQTLLAVVSTDAGGDPPISGLGLFEYLHNKSKADLGHLSYSVLALGDSYYYSTFCQAGKDFDMMLEKLGAHRIVMRMDCDVSFWNDFDDWLNDIISAINRKRKAICI